MLRWWRTSTRGARARVVGAWVGVCSSVAAVADKLGAPRFSQIGLGAMAVLGGLLGAILISRDEKEGAQNGMSKGRPRRRDAVRTRRELVDNVRRTWIRTVLEASPGDLSGLELELEALPQAVKGPWDAILQPWIKPIRATPTNRSVMEWYQELGKRLLILGDAGAGKTTVLLELARDLLDQADSDKTKPIPVIFHLSLWAQRRLPLLEWLVAELQQRYNLSRSFSKTWMAQGEIIVLLDGLNEMAPRYREGCVHAINTFRRDNAQVPVVTCCRTSDYGDISETLSLHGCVTIRPLAESAVERYLELSGKTLSGVLAVWRADEQFRSLLTTPLMLAMATVAYRDQPADALSSNGTVATRGQQLFASYVRHALDRLQRHTTRSKILRHLAWLARAMQESGQTVFYPGWMQPGWMPDASGQQVQLPLAVVAARLVASCAGAVLGASLAGITFGMLFFLCDTQVHLLIQAFTLTCIGERALPEGFRKEVETQVGWGDDSPIRRSTSGLHQKRRSFWTIFWAVDGMASVLVGAALGGLLGGAFTRVSTAMFLGLLVGLVLGRAAGFLGIVPSNVPVAAVLGFLLVVPSGCIAALVSGPPRTVFVGSLIGVIVGVANIAVLTVAHGVLRAALVRRGVAPWRYVTFLDDAAHLSLLHRVGEGYMFIHPLLLDYFASEEVRHLGGGDTTKRGSEDEYRLIYSLSRRLGVPVPKILRLCDEDLSRTTSSDRVEWVASLS
jgi:DNA polymerase III delta prime subunit